MNYLELIDSIIQSLDMSNEPALVKEIREIRMSAGTSTELLMTTSFRLKQIVESNEKLAKIISKDVLQLLTYCNSIGLVIK